ncbi:hypothetical protein GRI97_08150 [Altererythrobacter xixiisoli]|uniref:Terminase n=1 Tax=Croceibacterium xixiisoli TaxID=1476466 RepID=A0A6I4TWI3_9SPHN|nr:terminase gpA endonuclease subunit [Croceibacterium xixiisoli]MXO98958.1 hypothetical protein [Croceibacterium xixiisoli]
MEGLLNRSALSREVFALGSGQFFADPLRMLGDGLALFRPPEQISTIEWAEQHRKFRLPDSGALVSYDRMRTPYNIGPSDALDEPGVELVVMVKPSRSGGTTVAENYLGKMIDVGPMGRVGWILGSDKAVGEYCEGVIKPLFDDHPRLRAKIGTGRSDNNDKRKRVSGQLIEFLPANDSTFRNREFVFGVMDEPDGWSKFSESAKTQLEGRQKNIGRRRKGIILSHPDKGWKAGTAAAWVTTSRGIYVMRCAAPECRMFAAAYATKFWPGVPEFKLDYAKNERLSDDARVDLASRSAGMSCPHCGTIHDDKARFAMVDEAGLNDWWMHRGQTLDPVRGIEGEPDPHTERGFWVHGLMIKTSPAAKLAAGLEKALIDYERSGGSKVKTKALRELMSKQLGEIFEGKAGIEGVDSAKLQQRASQTAEAPALPRGVFPLAAKFITAAVDVGAGKFDISFRAWDLESRSWWLDRLTIRQRRWPDGRLRNLRTRDRIDDWDILIEEVILRKFPMEGDPDREMPVAAVAIDVSDGNVTWKGREFARRCLRRKLYWGKPAQPWARVRLIQGSPSPKADEVPVRPRQISEDENGKLVAPIVQEWTLGAHKLKELALERLAITDDGPGQCNFAADIDAEYYDEYFNEPLIDGKFERQGPNESLDLFGYEEAVRIMLKPDRRDLWNNPDRPPAWARPINLHQQPEGGDQAAPAEQPARPKETRSIMERMAALGSRGSGIR